MSIVESEEVADIVELEDPGLVNRAVVVQTMARLQGVQTSSPERPRSSSPSQDDRLQGLSDATETPSDAIMAILHHLLEHAQKNERKWEKCRKVSGILRGE